MQLVSVSFFLFFIQINKFHNDPNTIGPKIKNWTTEFGRFTRIYIPPTIPMPLRITETIVVSSLAFAVIPPLSNQQAKYKKSKLNIIFQ